MENGFEFRMFETVYKNCFIYSSNYNNGNLQLSLFGMDPAINQIGHFADITLNQNKIGLEENEIVVDCIYKNDFIPQLKKLGIIQEQTGICATNGNIYPIYTVNFNKISEKQYYMQELAVA